MPPVPAALAGPVRIGAADAPSRVVFGPHETNLGRRRGLSDRHVAYYARRAAGGAGVIVVETASVEPADWPYERAPLAAECGPGWAAIARAAGPAVVLAGLGHTGLEGSSAYSQSVLWGPSRVADVVTREPPAEMEQEQIDAVVAGFASAARRAVAAGLAGVEIDAGPRSLLRQFLSGLTNQRSDAYGEDKARLLVEVVAAVRHQIAGAVIALRLCADELAPWAGITPELAAPVVARVAHQLDLLTVVRGGPYSSTAYRPDGHTPAGFNWELCRTIREAAAGAVPVVWQGSVVDAEQAQVALDAGVADLVEMTRAQIADPDLVRHVRAGTPERVRPCVLCNQVCLVRDPRNPLVSCVGEPSAGYELTEPGAPATDPDPAEAGADPTSGAGPAGSNRRVVVVGGGPAGLECARVLAGYGARVQLVDAGAELGGAIGAAAVLPGRERFGRLVGWLVAECRRLGVDLRTGTRFGPDDAAAAEADGWQVLLATGSVAHQPEWAAPADSSPGPAVVDALTACRGGPDSLPPGPVVVIDPVGGPLGVGLAEWLAAAGREVTLVCPDPVAGTQLARTGDLADANGRLQRAGVVRALRAQVVALGPDAVDVEDVWTGERAAYPAAVVIDAGHRRPEEATFADRPDLPRAGDCVAPRTVLEAVLEGRRTARAVASVTEAVATHR